MSRQAAVRHASVDAAVPPLVGVRSDSSLGVSRYCHRLAAALSQLGVDYEPSDRPRAGRSTHVHLANSSRLPAVRAGFAQPAVLTVHDVLPRTRLLEPVYRRIVYPLLIDTAAAAVVHSRFAADLLARLGGRPRRLEVIPHAASRPVLDDRVAARRSLGLPGDRLLAVLPGVIKSAKLVREAVQAVGSRSVRRDWGLLLAGPVRDAGAAAEARRVGATVLDHPDDRSYEAAIVSADVVLCLRSGSVGETNGPLLDALGAGCPVLATATGSLPEVAAEAARYVEPTAAGIAAGLRAMADESERAYRAAAARSRAAELSWEGAAAAHADLFAEVFRA